MRGVFLSGLCVAMLAVQPAQATSPDSVFDAIAANKFDYAQNLARKNGNKLLIRYAYWAGLTDDHAHPTSFSQSYAIAKSTQNWPMHNRVRLRTEEAAFAFHPDKGAMAEFCKSLPPISGRGMFACVNAGVVDEKTRRNYIAEGWKNGDFRKDEEKRILASYGKSFSYADHRARIERLLFENKPSAARRILWKMNAADKKLFEARIALRAGARDAESKLRAVPTALKSDAGLIFDRMQWRHKKGLKQGVIEMLLAAPSRPPYANLWWPVRALAVRDALAMNRARDAMRILQKTGDVDVVEKAESLWLQGWVALEYLADARTAYEHFYTLYAHVNFPVSKARAAYWAAVAAERNGNADIARDWLKKAAQYGTVFYGQLAQARLNPDDPLEVENSVSVKSFTPSSIEGDDALQMVKLLARHGQAKGADAFLLHLATLTDDEDRLALLTSLAHHIGQDYDAVRVAKYALRKHVVLLDHGWPVISMPKNLAIEPALTLAIVRQESEFHTHAQSRAGARGLMQLLPRTAQETARKIGVPYGLSRLWETSFNLTVGSAYLGRMIDAYGGSLVPAIAAYNAGPGNVRKWLASNGSPGKSLEQTLRWIESIPFAETRNYVQRVLENLQIYRKRLGTHKQNAMVRDLLR